MSHYRLNITQASLMEMLSSVIGAIDRKAIHPGLVFAKVDVDKNTVTMTALDFEIQLVVAKEVELQEFDEPFSFCLPVRKIMDFTKALASEQNIEILYDHSHQKITLKANHCLLEAASYPEKDFPSFGQINAEPLFSIDPQDLKVALDAVSFSMAHNDIRYYLNGMLWHVEEGSTAFVATDGHRMALTSRDIEVLSPLQDGGVNMVLPRRTIIELNKLLSLAQEDVQILYGPSLAVIRLGDITFTTKLIEGKFPDYARVVPKESTHHLSLQKEKLKLALMQVQPIISSKNKGVELKFSQDQLKIFAQNSQGEQVTAIVDLEGVIEEKDQLSLGLNLAYIYEYLQTVKEETVQFCVRNSKSGVLLSHNPLTKYLVMPLTL